MDMEPISLSSSPNFSVFLFKPQKYKLYSKGLINITGSFLFVDNNNKKTLDTDIFFNLQTLTIDINNISFDINISTLQIENQTPNIYNVMMCTNIIPNGETLQREFYIPSTENITIKIIKSIHKYNNLVEITNVQKMKINNTGKFNILTAPNPIPRNPKINNIKKFNTLTAPIPIPHFLEHQI